MPAPLIRFKRTKLESKLNENKMKGINIKTIFWILSLCGVFCVQTCKDIERPSLIGQLLTGSHNRLGIVSSDLSGSGRFSLMSPEGIPQVNSVNIHSDAVARYYNNKVYIVNRLGRDNIQVLNPDILYVTEREFSVGQGVNPHDIAFAANDRAFISLYERDYIQVANPVASALGGNISLAAYADADGIPEASAIFVEGNFLYVALQRLDRNAGTGIFPPTAYSLLVEIDINTGQVVNSIQTPYTNPFGRFRRVELFGQPHLVIPMAGKIGVQSEQDGGVFAFNLSTRSFQPGALYSEIIAGGDILDVVIKNDSQGYAVVHFPDNSAALQRFNPTTGAREATLLFLPASGGYVAGLELGPNGYLYVAEAGYTDPGVVIYDTNSDVRLTPLAVPVGLRPADLVYIP